MLKRTAIRLFVVIILLLVLQIAGVLLNRFSPSSILYHQALIGAIQSVVIVWFFLALLFEFLLRKKRKPMPVGLLSVITLVVIISVGEIIASRWLKHPAEIPGPLKLGYRLLYQHNYRNIIQVVPECSEYSADFFYNLKPGNTCTYSNIEFSNRYSTNRMGFRDDDTSLVQPEIVCLGDSYMLGWGVEQDETLPALLEKTSGKKVLNAAMSSFGTVREMMRYKLIDTSAVKFVVLQYCFNDNEENKAYFDHNGKLPISPKAAYDSLSAKQDWNRVYFPGKYFVLSTKYQFKETVKKLIGRPPSHIGLPINASSDARMFLDVLSSSAINFQKTKLIAFVADDLRYLDGSFKKEVDSLLQLQPYKERFAGNLIMLDITGLMQQQDFYILDEHFKATGHQKLASEILKYIR